MGSKFRSKKVRAGRKKQTRKSERGRKKSNKIEKQWEKVRRYQKKWEQMAKILKRHTFLLVVISMT